MKTPIATSEDFARPSIGRPADDPNAPPKQRIVTNYRRNGTVLKTRVREGLTAAMDEVTQRFEIASGFHFSHTLLVRRALDLYLRQVAKFTDEQMAIEASILKTQHR
jgi:hypothetical protein